jgi:succinyl-diaminopimelate desuccinylase
MNMISGQLLKLAEKYDWKRHNADDQAFVFGTFNGFLFTAMEGNGFKAFFTSVAGISRENLERLKEWLADNKKAFRFRSFDMTDNFLCVRLQENWLPRTVSGLETFLIRLTGKLDELELPECACAVCGNTADQKGLYLDLFCYLHQKCSRLEGIDFTRPCERTSDSHGVQPVSPSAAKIAEIAESMEQYRLDIERAISSLVSIPSVRGEPEDDAPYGRNTAIVLNEFLKMASDLGFKTVNLENRAGYVEWGQGEKMIAALCHLDVVPDGTGWVHQPFAAVSENGRLYGRGTADDKGPAVAVLYAMKALSDEGYQPSSRIRLIVGLDEENGSGCMEWYKQNNELPAAGFTADASFPVIYAEKGIVWAEIEMETVQAADNSLRLIQASGGKAANMVPGSCELIFDGMEPIVVDGRQAHASRPQDGLNAVSLAMETASEKLKKSGSTHKFVDFFMQNIGMTTDGSLAGLDLEDESGALTLNAGVLHIDSHQSKLTVDIRYPVTYDFDTIKAMLEEKTMAAGAKCIWLKHQPPLYLEKDSGLIESLNKVYQVMTDTTVSPLAIGGGTYARSIPGIAAFGPSFPGDDDVCHQADEYISMQKLLAASAIYREALRALSR